MLWGETSLSGWKKNTSIIIIFDTNANPSAMLDICGWSGGGRNCWGKMDTNKMLIHHGLQVAPLTPLRSGGLSVPTPLSRLPPRELLGRRRLLLSPQRGRSPPIGLSLSAPCTVFMFWFEYMQMPQWSSLSKETPTTSSTALFPPPIPPPTRLPSFSSLLFLFVSPPSCCLLCSVGWWLWEPDLLCHTDLFKGGVRLLITRRRLAVYHREEGKLGV